MDFAALAAAYDELRPTLEKVANGLEAHLHDLAQGEGIRGATISSRAKETSSFVKKALERTLVDEAWVDPLSECTDKVGCRVDVVYYRDVLSLAEAIEADERLEVIKTDDKAVQLGTNALGYGGLHIDVIPRDQLDAIEEAYAHCEIQLRTHAQAAWAMASHELSYKGPGNANEHHQRRLNRLTALVELFDEVVDQVSEDIMTSENYPISSLIERLTSLWLVHVGRPYSGELTSSLLSTLMADMSAEEAERLGDELTAFITAHTEEINNVVMQSGSHPLLTQPELLVVYFCLNRDKYDFVERWIARGLDWRLLDSTASILGMRIPQPS